MWSEPSRASPAPVSFRLVLFTAQPNLSPLVSAKGKGLQLYNTYIIKTEKLLLKGRKGLRPPTDHEKEGRVAVGVRTPGTVPRSSTI